MVRVVARTTHIIKYTQRADGGTDDFEGSALIGHGVNIDVA